MGSSSFAIAEKSLCSGPEKGVITKGVVSLEESLEYLNPLDSLESRAEGVSIEGGRVPKPS